MSQQSKSNSAATAHDLKPVDASTNFAKIEEEVLAYWKEIDAFKISLKKSEGKKPFTFYDGPPFATGLPHYGHILAGTIKDVVTRYAHQTGHHVERKAGWDCHGLPIEFEIEKQLGIKTSDDVLEFGIGNYNEECRKIVMRYAGEWDNVVTRLGRWIDFEDDYKTMNLDFMESVWWVFGQLFKKGLVYRGFKVMPYSVGCTTPLSNFEANSNYKDVYDPAITVTFPLLDGDNGEALDPADPQTPQFVAWTTTPWTLPSNLCLCLNPTLDYVKLRDLNTQKVYIVAEARIVELYKPKKGAKKNAPNDYKVLAKYKGIDLKGRRYKPLFDYYANDPEFAKQAFRTVVDGYVTSDSGTGVVHCAPGFGEDDYRVCMENGIITKSGSLPCPVDPNGRFTSPVEEYKGTFVKDADEDIMNKLKENGRLVAKGSINHSYPFCFSPDTRVLMFDGSVRAITDVKMGDKLCGDDGTSRTVIDLIPRQSGQMYAVRQSKGETYYVNGNHILVVKARTGVHLSACREGILCKVQYYCRCDADSCANNCSGMRRTSKSFSTAEEAKTAMANPMEYLPGYVPDGTVFEITVQQWLNICAPYVRENFRGFRVPDPVQVHSHELPAMSKDSLDSTITVEETDERNEFCGVTVDGNERFLLKDCTVVHNCWRSETPLIYRAIPSWFVSVESIKDRLLNSNESTYWVPEFVKTKRFHNWLEDARDWAISRTRYWGTPIPLWVSDDWEEITCVSSVEELAKMTGKPVEEITDIHRHHIDQLTIPSKRPGHSPLRRVPDVMDCFTEDHQILTNKGFMFLTDIEQYSGTDLQFYSYDQDANMLVLEDATGIVIKDAIEGGRSMVEMTHAAEKHRWGAESDPYGRTKYNLAKDDDEESLRSNGVSIVATPGHDMFVRLGHVTPTGRFNWDGKYHALPGHSRSTLVPNPYAKHKASTLLGEGKAVKFLAAASGGIYQPSAYHPPLESLTSPDMVNTFLEVYGFWLGDGSLTFTPSGTRHSVLFTVVKKHDIEWLSAAFKVLQLDVTQRGPYGEKNQVAFDVKQKSFKRLFFDEYESKYASGCENASSTVTGLTQPECIKSAKWFAEWVWKLPKDQLRHIIAGLKRADGNQTPKYANTIFTSSTRFRDEIVRICLLAGYSAQFVVTHNGNDIIATQDEWEVSFSSLDKRSSKYGEPVLKSSTDIKSVTYHGRSWCVTLPHGFVIVRRAHRNEDGVVLKASRPVIAGNCWFESGSMPYAQMHYPFENVEKFEKAFPANFIAEGLDQCRGWFYTLLVLGAALFDKSPFTNVIVNGLVLATDGKKMSKRLKNYPDPMEVIHGYGADALRLYLINSPVVRAEALKFKEAGVKDVVKDLFIPWNNAYRFFVQQAIAFNKEHNHLFSSRDAAEMKSANVMDQWISSLVQSLVKFVRDEMQAYRLYTVIPKLLHNIDQLTNWYVRMNRKRLKGEGGKEDWYQSLCTLYDVLLTVTRTMAPFTPFLTESMYQNLKKLIPEDEREGSVHFLMIPEYDESRVNLDIERAVERMQQVVEVGRTIRDRKGIGLKTPLREAIVCHMDNVYLQDLTDFKTYICEELNTKKLQVTSELKSFLNLSASPNRRALGVRFKKQLRTVSDAIAKLTHEDCVQYVKTGKVTILGEHELSGDDIVINNNFTGDSSKFESQGTPDNALVVLNHVLDDELKQEGMSRVMTSTVQQLRKKAGLVPEDNINVYFEVQQDENGKLVRDVTQKYESLLSQSMKNMTLRMDTAPEDSKEIIRSKEDVTGTGALVNVVLTW